MSRAPSCRMTCARSRPVAEHPREQVRVERELKPVDGLDRARGLDLDRLVGEVAERRRPRAGARAGRRCPCARRPRAAPPGRSAARRAMSRGSRPRPPRGRRRRARAPARARRRSTPRAGCRRRGVSCRKAEGPRFAAGRRRLVPRPARTGRVLVEVTGREHDASNANQGGQIRDLDRSSSSLAQARRCGTPLFAGPLCYASRRPPLPTGDGGCPETHDPLVCTIVPILATALVAFGPASAQGRDWRPFPVLTTLETRRPRQRGRRPRLGPRHPRHARSRDGRHLRSRRERVAPSDRRPRRRNVRGLRAAPRPGARLQGRPVRPVRRARPRSISARASRWRSATPATRCSSSGEERGWPTVTEDDVEQWGSEVRLGLPRDFPEDQRDAAVHHRAACGTCPGPFVRRRRRAVVRAGRRVQRRRRAARRPRRVRPRAAAPSASCGTSSSSTSAVTRLLVARRRAVDRHGPLRARPASRACAGMLLHRPKRREWRQFAPDNSRISGDLVFDSGPRRRHAVGDDEPGHLALRPRRTPVVVVVLAPAPDGGGFELTGRAARSTSPRS